MFDLVIHEHSELSEPFLLYEQGAYTAACDRLLPRLSRGESFPNLHLLAAACLRELGEFRHARYEALQEALFFPENAQARALLRQLDLDVNGEFLTLEFDEKAAPASKPSISLALIVKNEEAHLAKCLDCFKDIADEIIMVDTGSTDRTAEIGRSYGAILYPFTWCDDFSAARNESLKYASCDWILRVDADEWITDTEKKKLLCAAASGKAEIYHGKLITHHLDAPDQIDENVRLIKNHCGVQFAYPIHESVGPSALQLGLRQALTNIIFEHDPDDAGLAEGKDKVERNLRIVDSALVREPENPYLRLIRGISRFSLDLNDGVTDLEIALAHLPQRMPTLKYLATAYVYLALAYIPAGDRDKMESVLKGILTDFYGDPQMLQFASEVMLYELGDYRYAGKVLAFALRLPASNFISDILPATSYNRSRIRQLMLEAAILCRDTATIREVFPTRTVASKTRKRMERQVLAASQAGDYEQVIVSVPHPWEFSTEVARCCVQAHLTLQHWQSASDILFHLAGGGTVSAADVFQLILCQLQLNHIHFAADLLPWAEELSPSDPVAHYLRSLIEERQGNIAAALDQAGRAFLQRPADREFQNRFQSVAARLDQTPVPALKTLGLQWLATEDSTAGLSALVAYSRFQPDDLEVKQKIESFLRQEP